MSFSFQFSNSNNNVSFNEIENIFNSKNGNDKLQKKETVYSSSKRDKSQKWLEDALKEDDNILDFDGFLESNQKNVDKLNKEYNQEIINNSIERNGSNNQPSSLYIQKNEPYLLKNNSNSKQNISTNSNKPKYILDMLETVQKRKEALQEIKALKQARSLENGDFQVYITDSYKEELERKKKDEEEEKIKLYKLRQDFSMDTNIQSNKEIFNDSKSKNQITTFQTNINPITKSNITLNNENKLKNISKDETYSISSNIPLSETNKSNNLGKRKERPDSLSNIEIEEAKKRYLKRLEERKKSQEQS